MNNDQSSQPALADTEIADLFSAERELALALRFEAALAEAQACSGLISADAASAIVRACRDFELDEDQLAHGVRRDGMIVPELVRQIREMLPDTTATLFISDLPVKTS